MREPCVCSRRAQAAAASQIHQGEASSLARFNRSKRVNSARCTCESRAMALHEPCMCSRRTQAMAGFLDQLGEASSLRSTQSNQALEYSTCRTNAMLWPCVSCHACAAGGFSDPARRERRAFTQSNRFGSAIARGAHAQAMQWRLLEPCMWPLRASRGGISVQI